MTRLQRSPEVELRRGPTALEDLGPPLDHLMHALGVPVTNRLPWFTAWLAAHPEVEPVIAVAWQGGELDAAILLAASCDEGPLVLTGLGYGRNDRSRLLAKNPQAALAVADSLADELLGLAGPWTLRIEQLPAGDAVATRLAERVPGLALVPGGSIPGVDFACSRVLEEHLTKNLRRQLRKCHNRMAADGLQADIAFTRAPEALLPLLDEVEEVHRSRDHAVGRISDIDDAQGRALWRGIILEHVRCDMVEIASLRLGGELAAYVVSILDGDRYRVLDGRFASRFEHYSPGRVLETETLGWAMADERFAGLDWMNSVAPDKLISANRLEATQHLTGSSALAR